MFVIERKNNKELHGCIWLGTVFQVPFKLLPVTQLRRTQAFMSAVHPDLKAQMLKFRARGQALKTKSEKSFFLLNDDIIMAVFNNITISCFS